MFSSCVKKHFVFPNYYNLEKCWGDASFYTELYFYKMFHEKILYSVVYNMTFSAPKNYHTKAYYPFHLWCRSTYLQFTNKYALLYTTFCEKSEDLLFFLLFFVFFLWRPTTKNFARYFMASLGCVDCRHFYMVRSLVYQTNSTFSKSGSLTGQLSWTQNCQFAVGNQPKNTGNSKEILSAKRINKFSVSLRLLTVCSEEKSKNSWEILDC